MGVLIKETSNIDYVFIICHKTFELKIDDPVINVLTLPQTCSAPDIFCGLLQIKSTDKMFEE